MLVSRRIRRTASEATQEVSSYIAKRGTEQLCRRRRVIVVVVYVSRFRRSASHVRAQGRWLAALRLPLLVVLCPLPLFARRFPLLRVSRLQSLPLLLRVPRGFVRQVRQLRELLVFYYCKLRSE